MYEILKAEFKRYRKWGFLALVLQLLAWAVTATLMPLLQPYNLTFAILHLVIVSGSFGFGALQMRAVSRKNHWTWLLQRPVSSHNIFHGLILAGAGVLAIAAPLAWLLIASGMDMFTAEVVDARHYMLVPYLMVVALISYLIGTLTILSASRGAAGMASLLIIFLMPKASSLLVLFLAGMIILAALYFVNRKAFKPDLKQHVTEPVAASVMAVPMMATIVFLMIVVGTTSLYHLPKFVMGTHPDARPIDGTHSYIWSLERGDVITHMLKNTNLPNKGQLGRQAALADFDSFDIRLAETIIPGQLHIEDQQYALVDPIAKTKWVFSHDQMVLVGTHTLTGKRAGYLGKKGFLAADADPAPADQFKAVPLLHGMRFIQTDAVIYEVNFEDQLLSVKHQVEAGDSYKTNLQINDHYVTIATAQKSYLFDKRRFMEEGEEASADHVIAHPAPMGSMDQVWSYRLLDGYILFYHGRNMGGFDKPAFAVIHTRLGHKPTVLSQQNFAIRGKHPAVIRHFAFMTSPTIYVLFQSTMSSIEGHTINFHSLSSIVNRDVPGSVIPVMISLMMMSGVVLLLWSRRLKLPKAQTLYWTVIGLIFSAPAIICFMLMNRWKNPNA